MKFVKDKWKKLQTKLVQDNFKGIKKPIVAWSKNNFGDIDEKIDKMKGIVSQLEKLSELRILNEEEKCRLTAAKGSMSKWFWKKGDDLETNINNPEFKV